MTIFEELRQLYIEKEQNNLVIFVGAGISENYENTQISRYSLSPKPKIKDGKKFPSWNDLVKEFIPDDMSEKSGVDDLKRVQIYQDLNSKESVTLKVQELFPRDYDCFDIHQLIFDTEPEHVITTNYDHLLEKAMRLKWDGKYQVIDCDEAIPFSKSKRNFLVKAHGDICRGNIVLSEKDYNDYDKNFPLILSFLRYVFSKYKILFIGFSLNDPNFNKILYWVKNILNENSIRHTVILHSDISQSERNYFQKRSVDVITSKEISQNFLSNENKSYYLVEALQIIKYGFPSCNYTFKQKTQTFDKNIESIESFNYLLPEHVNTYLSNLTLKFDHYIEAETQDSNNKKTKRYPWVANLYDYGSTVSNDRGFNLNTWLAELDTSEDSLSIEENQFIAKVLRLFIYANIGVIGMSGFTKYQKQISEYLDPDMLKKHKYLLTYNYELNDNNESARFTELDNSFNKNSPYYELLTLSSNDYYTEYMLGDKEKSYKSFKAIEPVEDTEVSKYLKYFRLRFLNKNRKITNIGDWDQNEGRYYEQIFQNIGKFNQNLLLSLHNLNFIQEFVNFNIKLEKDFNLNAINKNHTWESGWDTKDLYQISFYINYSRFLKFTILNKLPIIDDERFQNAIRVSNSLYFKHFFMITGENNLKIPNWILIGLLLDNNKTVFQDEIIQLHNKYYTSKINCSFDREFVKDLVLLNSSNKNNESKLIYIENIIYLVSLTSENKENFDLVLGIFHQLVHEDIIYFELYSDSLNLAFINFKKQNKLTEEQKQLFVEISNIFIENVLNNRLNEKVTKKFRDIIGSLANETFIEGKNNSVKSLISSDKLQPINITLVFKLLKILGYTKNDIKKLVNYLKKKIKEFELFADDTFTRNKLYLENEILILYHTYNIDLGMDKICLKYIKLIRKELSSDSISTSISTAFEWMNILIDDTKFKAIIKKELTGIEFNICFDSYIKTLKEKKTFDFMSITKTNLEESFKLFIKIGRFDRLDQDIVNIFSQIKIFEFIAGDLSIIEQNCKSLKLFLISSKSFQLTNKPLTVSFLVLIDLYINDEITSVKLRPLLRGVLKELMFKND